MWCLHPLYACTTVSEQNNNIYPDQQQRTKNIQFILFQWYKDDDMSCLLPKLGKIRCMQMCCRCTCHDALQDLITVKLFVSYWMWRHHVWVGSRPVRAVTIWSFMMGHGSKIKFIMDGKFFSRSSTTEGTLMSLWLQMGLYFSPASPWTCSRLSPGCKPSEVSFPCVLTVKWNTLKTVLFPWDQPDGR